MFLSFHPASDPGNLSSIGLGSDSWIDCQGAEWPCESDGNRNARRYHVVTERLSHRSPK
jgi:hypothetical protein